LNTPKAPLLLLLLQGKLRLDAYLAQQLPEVSRAKIAASIKEGLIRVNGASVSKPSLTLKGGERISVELLPPEPCTVSWLPDTAQLWRGSSSSSSSSSSRCQQQQQHLTHLQQHAACVPVAFVKYAFPHTVMADAAAGNGGILRSCNLC
jgi:ribosomal protein S4